jgi:hypothetical protein
MHQVMNYHNPEVASSNPADASTPKGTGEMNHPMMVDHPERYIISTAPFKDLLIFGEKNRCTCE